MAALICSCSIDSRRLCCDCTFMMPATIHSRRRQTRVEYQCIFSLVLAFHGFGTLAAPGKQSCEHRASCAAAWVVETYRVLPHDVPPLYVSPRVLGKCQPERVRPLARCFIGTDRKVILTLPIGPREVVPLLALWVEHLVLIHEEICLLHAACPPLCCAVPVVKISGVVPCPLFEAYYPPKESWSIEYRS